MSEWFETVAEAQRRARKRLPASVYSALVAGSERGLTAGDNTTAFAELGFAPHVADLSDSRELSTTLMGQPLSFPVMISPTGVQAVHPDGEVAVARAAAARGVSMGLSLFASKPIEEVVAANPQTFFQVHWVGSRELLLHMLDRARAAGAVGLIVTMDWSFSEGRDWGSPVIPERLDARAMLRLAPEALARPRWLARWARTGTFPDLTAPNLAPPGKSAPTFFAAYREWKSTPLPSWEDVAWLREQWDGPFMLKGIGRVDDALRAVDAGVTAISVSNHGGNNLDGAPASIRTLPAIADAVGNQVEVTLDGGIRRGSDVAKALALGARAVLIGRAYLWGLAANGQAGAENVLDILRGGLDSAVLGLGHSSVHTLEPTDVVAPHDFTRANQLPGLEYPTPIGVRDTEPRS
ncbi:mycofactocin biosynthesis FMN-dependent deaminase MftD [Rhodococcus fascians]|nr:mycofactocin biosynthesis FMN-dependent deaminase MftD [Rhodococcus fascians]MBY4397891.1 mycofactocin biosynthesis FMN-dependent deaminase MftD [Rhodococcus fascians]MBY4407832.1 mycofactocin biosynthesis FMN-dependent deaminase MftD [Rhodococcus fascians]MBY4422750.1 mycofactocin biosynthesis FMN-dependent deaminase MftD [Rhodococcus fascians]MBY4462245.1 mycofactocin biosynthesis FMN-dependent deaminase MftD [Rhodococcus fascians]